MSDNPATKQQKETPSTPPTKHDPTQAAVVALPEKDLEKVSGGAHTSPVPPVPPITGVNQGTSVSGKDE